MIAEVPETLGPACQLFSASGYVSEALLTDYVLEPDARDVRQVDHVGASRADAPAGAVAGFVIPVTVDDLAANGLLGEADPHVCWERSVETLTARKDEIGGLAVASDEQIEAYVLYLAGAGAEAGPDVEIVSLRTFVEDGGTRLKHLLARLSAQSTKALRFPRVHPGEIPTELLEALGFHPAGRHRLYAATAG
jgi:hypothetical protein